MGSLRLCNMLNSFIIFCVHIQNYNICLLKCFLKVSYPNILVLINVLCVLKYKKEEFILHNYCIFYRECPKKKNKFCILYFVFFFK